MKYLLVFFILLVLEVLIALFVKDRIVRPFIGDILVMILMYTFIRGIIKKPIKGLPVYLFIFAVCVEISQYFHLVDKLNLRSNRIMTIIMGTSFDIKDILCYFAGTIIIIIWERRESKLFPT